MGGPPWGATKSYRDLDTRSWDIPSKSTLRSDATPSSAMRILHCLLLASVVARKLPKSVVINLPRHEARYEGAKRELNAAGVKFERLDAVEGRRLDPAEKQANVTALARALITPGMTGCFLSHRRCWERCVALDEDLLVFEDDIMLEADFAKYAAAARTAALPRPALTCTYACAHACA